MKKLLSLLLLGGALLVFTSCSTDDDEVVRTTPAQLFGTWSLVNDADPNVTTTLTFSNEKFINYSATHTSQNPTIPANAPTYTRSITTITPATGWEPATAEYSREQGYFTVSGNTLTLWPQVGRTSTDGTTWTETAAADMTSMEEYTYVLNNNNVMILTTGAGAKQTYLR